MPEERSYGGNDKIAGTPTKHELPANRKVGGHQEAKPVTKTRFRRVRRAG